MRKLLVTLFVMLILSFGALGVAQTTSQSDEEVQVESEYGTVILNHIFFYIN